MRIGVWLAWLSLAAATSASGPVAAQTIDCSKARSPTEKAICATPGLMTLDRQIAGAFADALARQPERRDALRAGQAAWLRQRDAACALPPREIPACLSGQITARIAALAPAPAAAASAAAGPPGPGPVAAAVPGTQIDPPLRRLPDPAIPRGALPAAAATLEQTSLPAGPSADTLLHVTVAGRFTLSVHSAGGAALQLIDMLTGPGEPAGAAGSQDGRLDPLLDVGTYKVRAMAAEGASGAMALSVVAFHDAAPPAALPQPGRDLSSTLRDGEQRAFWLAVPPDGSVRVEAAGRSLADLRLWRDGRDLSALDPAVTVVEPVPGHPLTDIRLDGKVEPGTYLAVAYGGRAAAWTDNDAGQPFLLRSGASDALQAGWAGGPVGPFGSEVFSLPASAGLIRLQLPQAAAAMVRAGPDTATIARDSREPSATLTVVPGQRPTVEVQAAAGQAFTLRVLEQPAGRTFGRAGTFWVSAVANGAGGDEVPPTVLLERLDRSGKPARIVADTLPSIGPDRGWRTRFNLRGPTTLVARSAGGPVAVRTTGVPVRGGQGNADLPDGVYDLTLTPEPGALGAVEVLLGPPGSNPAPTPPLPSDPVLPLGVQAVGPGESLRLTGGTAPGLRLGLSARPVPVALVEGALAVTLAAGATATVPVVVAPGGTLSVSEVGSGNVPYARTEAGRQSQVMLPAADHARTVMLAWRRTGSVSPIPAPAAPEAAAVLRAGTPAFFSLDADEKRSFGLEVPDGGLYRIETLGRLRTSGQLATPFIPRLGEASANGVGQNMLIQTALRAGRYRVQVSAQDSAGRAGLLATPAPLLPLATLRPGGSVRATLPAGSGGVVPVEVAAAAGGAPAVLHLDAASLGTAWTGRLEDAEGWPLIRPGALDGIERAMPAGRYRLVVEPAPVARQVVLRLRPVLPAVEISGHGPHPLPFGTRRTATWREPDSQAGARTPDRWTFSLAGRAEVTLTLTDTMTGALMRVGAAAEGQAARRVLGRFKEVLEAGDYALDVTSLGRNDRAVYTLGLDSKELQPGAVRSVALPATLPFALADGRVASLTSFGTVPVKAVLRDAGRRVVARTGAREDDWNIALSRPLPAGAYTLELTAAGTPDMTDTTLRDGPPDADAASGSDGGSSGGDDDDSSGAAASATADDQAAQTRASQLADPVPKRTTPDAGGGGDDSDDKPGPRVEVLLALPPGLAPAEAPARVQDLPGVGVHVLTLPQPPADSLVVAQARSDAALVLVLERADGGGWRTVATDGGRSPVVAAPADGDGRAWRVQAWAVDGGPDPIRLAARAVTAAEAAPGRVALLPLDGMAGAVAVARVGLPPGLARVGGQDAVLAGSWPGHGLTAAAGGMAVPQSGRLWLLGEAGTVDVAALVPGAGDRVAVTVPAGLVAGLPSGTGTAVWLAQSGLAQAGMGQPSLGGATGWAPGSAMALGAEGASVPLRSGDDGALRAVLQRVELRAMAEQAVEGALHATVPPLSALPVRLPAGDKLLQLDLPAGTGAVPGWRAPAAAAWAGEAATSRDMAGRWTEVLLVNTGAAPAAMSLATSPAPAAAALAPGQVLKRFFGAAGSFEVAVAGADGARLHLAGAGGLTLIGADGAVSTGPDLVAEGAGRAVVSHTAGAVALWMEGPGASPWPGAAPQPMPSPGSVALSGPAMAFALREAGPVLLHASTTAPVYLGLVQPGRTDGPTPYPAGAEVHRIVAAGAAELRLFPPQDGGLTGSLMVRAEPIVPAAEGLGAAVSVAPGGAAAFGFSLAKATTIGVGVRAEPDRASARLLDATGKVVGEGVAQLVRLEAGRYVLEATVPPDAPTTVLRPALVGITPRPSGPPPDVVRDYLELAGMKPQGSQP